MCTLPLRLKSALPLPSNRSRIRSRRYITQQLRTAISSRRERNRTCTGSPSLRLAGGVSCKRRSLKIRAALANEDLETDAEKFVKNVGDLPYEEERKQVSSEIGELEAQRQELQGEIDALYKATFGEVVLGPEADLASTFDRFTGEQEVATGGDEVASGAPSFPELTEAQFSALGRDSPTQMRQLLQKVQQDSSSWTQFQRTAQTLQLRKTRVVEALERKHRELNDVVGKAKLAAEVELEDDQELPVVELPARGVARIVLISGFESFNVTLYRKAAEELAVQFPGLQLTVFSDRDISSNRPAVEAALDNADVFFGSLLFDYDQVEWLREKVERIPTRLVFESALELMGTTQVGTFKMEPSGKSKGPPPVVKAILNKFGSGREEDKMVGYLSFLKIGPKLLKWLPGKKVRDLRNWLTVYSYWNEGGKENVKEAFLYLVNQYFFKTNRAQEPVSVTPPIGLLHPRHKGYFTDPREYLKWHKSNSSLPQDAPVVSLILYRKHVITKQDYIRQLIELFEEEGLRPLPIFINGVEAHTVVRDMLTTSHEQQQRSQGAIEVPSLAKNAVHVDAIVNTIGFPLVGGPAGSMEGGRQAEVAKAILTAKNVPYLVAAPMLIQDMESWTRDGIGGLQSIVLYALPELDGAIDTVTLGGLVGDDIFLSGERVKALATRLRKWINLRRTPPSDRRIAVLLYGFPPGVGATGTAALLNVPKSLEAFFKSLKAAGYNLGDDDDIPDGEAVVDVLRAMDDERAVLKGRAGMKDLVANLDDSMNERLPNVTSGGDEVTPVQLQEWLTFPSEWGPSEWGPIPFLPSNTLMLDNLQRQWGDVRSYRGIKSAGDGQLVVPGVQLGNVWIGVQPVLGLEGDPMRLLFERDLTPHPQYAAFYKWLQNSLAADAVVHFGMHGTVEWLPGTPLGNTGFSWSDALLGPLPNVYVYAANNPSESIVAKRRGYGTIVSHNVPPYGRAGLYKQLAELKDLVNDAREAPDTAQSLREPILAALVGSGLQEDCPFEEGATITSENLHSVSDKEFTEYTDRLYKYLQVVEGRLFSEGLHVLGSQPTSSQLEQYLAAYFGDDLDSVAVETVANTRGGLDQVRGKLGASLAEGTGGAGVAESQLAEAVEIRDLLLKNTEELESAMKALNGEFVLPAAGGDLLRDGPGVLPTGRNIHALDPYRMPSPAAMQRGSVIAEGLLTRHQEAHNGALPETVAVALWGLDAIKTKGESVGIALTLIGARPVKESTGRIVRYELIPLEELGRPRVDVLCNMSGIFRDSFVNVVELLDDAFRRAAEADEPEEMNFVRKHASAMEAEGLENSSARLFSNPAGDYGSMVNERVGAGNWDAGEELGSTWASRNSFSYGRGREKGTARPEVLQKLLGTTEHIVQEIDSVEYGLTDIQEYYANTGALQRAASSAQGGKKVAASVVETFGKAAESKDLEAVLRLEYRSKLLNPKWAEAMAKQGSGGAFEISQRMTALVGWGATSDFTEDWVYDGAYETYVDDDAMREKLRKANPQAFQNVVKRMLEAAGRGMWNADEATLEKLKQEYMEMDDVLEGVCKA